MSSTKKQIEKETPEITMEDFIKGETAKREADRDDAMREKGLHPYLTLKAGELVKFTLLREIPTTRINDTWDKQNPREQYVFAVMQGEIRKDWTVTINSPFAGEVLEKLQNAPIELTVLRTGEKKDTRYQFIKV